MLDNKEFDLWVDGYDKSVQLSDEDNQYPFAGYKDVLNTIYNIVRRKEKSIGYWIWHRSINEKTI